MSTQAHLDSLHHKHEELESMIHYAYTHHLPVADLKKQKLRVKEEISAMESSVSNENRQPQEAA